MNTLAKHIFIGIRFLLLILCYVFAIKLESPHPYRFFQLSSIFAILLLSIHSKEYSRIKKSRYYPYTYCIDGILLFILEYHSKFLLNYYFHFIYMILILSSGIQLSRKLGTVINLSIFCLSMTKFVTLLKVNSTTANISMTIFNFFTFVLILLILNYGKYHSEEREKINLLYTELQTYSNKVKELTITEERHRMAMELHDSMGHRMTGLIMELEMCKRFLGTDQKKAEQLILHAIDSARDGLVEVRKSVDTLKSSDGLSSMEGFQEMINNFHIQSGIQVQLTLFPEKIHVPSSIALTVYRIIQEALTNAAKHSQCTLIQIQIRRESDCLSIKIQDNGACLENFVEGNGLKGMRQRVKEVRGTITFSSTSGFCIYTRIPISSMSQA